MNKEPPGKTESDMFRTAVRGAIPVRSDVVVPRRRKPKPIPVQRHADEREVLKEMRAGLPGLEELETGNEALYRSSGLSGRELRRLRRGQFAIEAHFDLHGLTSDEARVALAAFLDHAIAAERRCVRIIHGKGLGSAGGQSVLKPRIQRWLRVRKDVLGFCSARPVDGGTGAMYVLLKRQR
jgi:DNA-nicking Smr family endonuclease